MSRLVLVACGCCLALALGACGDDGEMTTAEYFAEVEAVGATFVEARDAMAARVDAAEDRRDAAREYYTGGLAAFETLMSEFESLKPPEEVREVHDRFVARGRALVSAGEGAVEALEGVETLTELAVFENSDAVTAFISANNAAIDSCVEMEEAAADHGITMDLLCPE